MIHSLFLTVLHVLTHISKEEMELLTFSWLRVSSSKTHKQKLWILTGSDVGWAGLRADGRGQRQSQPRYGRMRAEGERKNKLFVKGKALFLKILCLVSIFSQISIQMWCKISEYPKKSKRQCDVFVSCVQSFTASLCLSFRSAMPPNSGPRQSSALVSSSLFIFFLSSLQHFFFLLLSLHPSSAPYLCTCVILWP